MIFGHAVFEADFIPTLSTSVGVQRSQFGPTPQTFTNNRLRLHIFREISLAVHSFVNTEILFDCKVRVDLYSLVAERTAVDLFVLFFVLEATMRFYGRVVGTVD